MNTMEEQKNHLLEELTRRTGLFIVLPKEQDVDEAQIVNILERFLEPYRKSLDLSEFWLSFLRGNLSAEETSKSINRFHLKEATTAVVFLLCFSQGVSAEAETVLGDLFGEGSWILHPDENHLILLRLLRNVVSTEKLREEAKTLVDTLSAEIMVPVSVSFDECVERLSELPDSFKKVEFAENCGRRFSPGSQVHAYHDLGLGKLIGKLTKEDCREYLEDHLGGFRFDAMDQELSITIHIFFEEGLSIARTSRRLYVHRNTLVYRLDKFEKLSGLDLRRFDDAVTARLAMLMETYLEGAVD